MPFLSESLEALTRQLVFAPVSRRRLQIDHAEAFYWQIEADRVYPLEFIVYRLTQYRPDTVDVAESVHGIDARPTDPHDFDANFFLRWIAPLRTQRLLGKFFFGVGAHRIKISNDDLDPKPQ